ncbi:MAG: histidine kinase [Bacteroidota bacterium]|nr:histidine kinase [Bacteroidota bacterium]MDP4259794.1 histidine kinase [Bacteroidota bacterium]
MHSPKQQIWLLAILIVGWTNSLKAQPGLYEKEFEAAKDSEVAKLRQHPAADTGRVMALINILDCASFLSQKKTVMVYWQEASRLSRQLKFRKGEAICLEWIGSYYKSSQKIDSATIYFDSALLIAGSSTDLWLRRTKGFIFFQKAMIAEGQENYYTALNDYFDALKNYDSSDLVKQKMVFIRIASIYQRLFNDDKALEYYHLTLETILRLKGNNNNIESAGIYSFIAGIHYNRGDLQGAKQYLNKLAPFMPDTVETMITGGYYHLAGQIAMRENHSAAAIENLQQALTYYSATAPMHIDDISNVCADIARLKLATGDLQDAKRYADSSIGAARRSVHKAVMANALTAMSEYYSRTGAQSKAYQSLRLATAMNDTVLAAANIKQANTLSAIYESDQKEKEIARLELDKKVQSGAVRQKALLNTIFIIALVAFILISFILYLNFSKTRKLERQRIRELEKEKQLMGIEAMLKGQEEERSRLARDLHDGLGSMLSGVKISFSNLRDHISMNPGSALTYDKTLEQLDRTIAELRKVAHNLMPEALVQFGLRSAVKDFCESIRLTGHTEIICEQFGSDRELGNIADVNVYRIVQELINNAINHGKADRILVQVTKTAEKVLITVEDDGRGFDTGALKSANGIGWTNIQSRVNYFNGIIDIESRPREGTTINIELVA